MPNDLVNPIARAIAAARALPSHTGQTEKTRARAHMILADVSHSMSSMAHGGRRKIDELRDTLTLLDIADVLAFSDAPRQVAATRLPEPSGGTNLAAALIRAQSLGAMRLLVISDGRPDDMQSALAVAATMPAQINTLYIGPETDVCAIEFMRKLSTSGRRGPGSATTRDLARPQSLPFSEQILRLLGK